MASVGGGVGGGLPHRVGFRDSRDSEVVQPITDQSWPIMLQVVLLRPMREVSSKEVSLYTLYSGLNTWHGQETQGVSDSIR